MLGQQEILNLLTGPKAGITDCNLKFCDRLRGLAVECSNARAGFHLTGQSPSFYPLSIMAITIEELSGILTRGEIKHAFDNDGDIYFGFQTENYTNPDGAKTLGMHLSVSNEGQIFSLTAHHAFKVKGSKHVDTFLKLCSIIQMSGHIIQFEYLPTAGTVRPCIEIPLLDNKLTKSQLDFCIASMVKAMEDYYPPLQKALETGSLEGLPEEMLKAMKEESSDDTSTL